MVFGKLCFVTKSKARVPSYLQCLSHVAKVQFDEYFATLCQRFCCLATLQHSADSGSKSLQDKKTCSVASSSKNVAHVALA